MFDFSKHGMQDFLNELRDGLPGGAKDKLSQGQLRSILEAMLRKLQLVTREEFDAQQAVLLRTRLKLETLEKELRELQAKVEGVSDNRQPESTLE